jgi:hypothetical protein
MWIVMVRPILIESINLSSKSELLMERGTAGSYYTGGKNL